MILSLIVAAAENGVIGKDGKIPWFVRGEQAIFKEVTMDHPIIMGRKTHESIPQVLPGRLNIVVSRNPDYQVKQGAILVDSLQKGLSLPEVKQSTEIFIIGGGEIFKDALPLADKIYFTRVHTTVQGGNTFFKFNPEEWRMLSSHTYLKNEVPDRPYDFEFQVWERK